MAQWLGLLLRDPKLISSDPLLNLIPGSTSRLYLILKKVCSVASLYVSFAQRSPCGEWSVKYESVCNMCRYANDLGTNVEGQSKGQRRLLRNLFFASSVITAIPPTVVTKENEV